MLREKIRNDDIHSVLLLYDDYLQIINSASS